jgi:alkyl hydroperoxide reductase subunit AhpF
MDDATRRKIEDIRLNVRAALAVEVAQFERAVATVAQADDDTAAAFLGIFVDAYAETSQRIAEIRDREVARRAAFSTDGDGR